MVSGVFYFVVASAPPGSPRSPVPPFGLARRPARPQEELMAFSVNHLCHLYLFLSPQRSDRRGANGRSRLAQR